MNDVILLALSALVVVGIVHELNRDTDAEYQIRAAHELGWQQAAQGFGREDWPTDYTDVEREAWQRGWDEYMEGRS